MRFLPLLAVGMLLTGCASTAHLRYPPTRWVVDRDRQPVDPPKPRREYMWSDVVNHHFLYQFERTADLSLRAERGLNALGIDALQEALNVNNFDEVADSSWFTNRMGRRTMTIEELKQGPNQMEGPGLEKTMTIIKAKTEGRTPGFLIEDEKGEKYLLKFDPAGYPDLVTAAEMIGTKIMHAIGFHVPEAYLVTFHPRILKISPKATDKDVVGRTVPFTEERLGKIFRRIAEVGEGRYRALASRYVEGKPLGPFPLRGRRRNDPNDRIPHEHRRELRGHRVFASWIANNDAKEANTLDSFIKTGPGEKGYVRHHLFDFGNSLGAASHSPKGKVHLGDYRFNARKVGASLVTLGAYQPDWEKVEDPDIESVGIFESKYFDPEKWRPIYPNPAFQNMTRRDAFWAAKIVMKFSNADIRGIVEEGRYSDPRAADYVTQTLIERRDKVGRYWFSKVNPLDNFLLKTFSGETQVSFDDLMILSGLAPSGSALYRYRIIQEKNVAELIPWTETEISSLSFPNAVTERMKPGKNYLLQIQTRRNEERFWGPIVDVILKKSEEGIRMRGLNRRYGD